MLNDNNVNVLIVDDLPDNLLALEAVIRLEGRTIFQASSGEEALALLLSHEFALAILDVQMPGMNGFELAELMRGTEKTRHIPIVFVTAAGKESNFAFKGYESGAVDFLYKPLDLQAVQSKVNVFALMYRQRLETRRQVLALEKSRQEQEALLANLQTTQMALEKALKLRDEFMSVVAHELRTPLNTLFMDVQMRKMLLDRGKIAVFDAAYLEKMVTRDQRQVQSMLRLIDDMLDVTRIRSNHLSIRPALFDLQAMLGRVVGNLNLQAQAAGSAITLHADQPVTGCWDEFRIEQVVTNLLTNALRYGNGKPVEVSLVLLGGSVAIHVRDQGKGIPVQDQQRIFDPFERAVGQDDSTSGLGLGLYITRQLVQAHGGTINVQSQEAEGSLFSVMLPLTVPATAPL
jgi:signal transduction histidine kinase